MPELNPAYALNIAENPTGDLYLECDECTDIITGMEPGMALLDALNAAQLHYDAYHHPHGLICGPGGIRRTS